MRCREVRYFGGFPRSKSLFRRGNRKCCPHARGGEPKLWLDADLDMLLSPSQRREERSVSLHAWGEPVGSGVYVLALALDPRRLQVAEQGDQAVGEGAAPGEEVVAAV